VPLLLSRLLLLLCWQRCALHTFLACCCALLLLLYGS
jgi:hypothetical protein